MIKSYVVGQGFDRADRYLTGCWRSQASEITWCDVGHHPPFLRFLIWECIAVAECSRKVEIWSWHTGNCRHIGNCCMLFVWGVNLTQREYQGSSTAALQSISYTVARVSHIYAYLIDQRCHEEWPQPDPVNSIYHSHWKEPVEIFAASCAERTVELNQCKRWSLPSLLKLMSNLTDSF